MNINPLYLLIGLFLSYGSAIEELTEQICVNMGAGENELQSVSLSYSDYVDFIEKSAYFVDKSLLIRYLLQNRAKSSSNVRIITAPKKWGKTLNLKMVEYFAQIELDSKGKRIPQNQTSAYQYFTKGIIPGTKIILENPPLLSNHTAFINGHLATYPVIYLDFTKLEAEQASYESIFESFCQIISEIFSKHAYAKSILEDKQETTRFTKIMNGKQKNFDEMTGSIHFLAQVLHKYFKKLPLILQDGFDRIIIISHFNKNKKFLIADREKSRQLFAMFLLNSYNDIDNKYLALLTGELNFEKGFFPGMKKIIEYNVFNDRVIFPYFGFTKTEVSSLLGKQGFQDDLEKVEKFYSGYKFINKPDVLFNPWSIVNYIRTKTFTNFMPKDSEMAHVIQNLCKYRSFRETIESLIRQLPIDFTKHHTKILVRECESLTKLVKDESDELTLSTNSLLAILYNAGYLTSYNESSPFKYKLVNREASHSIASLVLNNYNNLFEIDKFSLIVNECAVNLNDFVHSKESTSDQLKKAIKSIFQSIGSFQDSHVQDILADTEFDEDIEGFIYCILFIPTLELHAQYDYDIRKTRSSIIATTTGIQQNHGNNIALIIQPIYDDKENVDLENVKHKEFDFESYFQNEPHIDVIKLVEVQAKKDGHVKVICTMKTNDDL